MLVILCMLWVMNLAFACAEGNRDWWLNLIVALFLTVNLVAVQVGAWTP